MATADRAVVVLLRNFNGIRNPNDSKNGLIHHSSKMYSPAQPAFVNEGKKLKKKTIPH